jgi:hypothetical protein
MVILHVSTVIVRQKCCVDGHNIINLISACNLKQRHSERNVTFCPYLESKPVSGASIGVPANSLQLGWYGRYITVCTTLTSLQRIQREFSEGMLDKYRLHRPINSLRLAPYSFQVLQVIERCHEADI